MKAKLDALNAELDLVKEEYNAIYEQMITRLDSILNKWFVDPFGAKCLRRWFKEEFFPEKSIYINFEIGFHNTEEDRTDFGSDMWFEYSGSSNQLKVNHGTCGSYSKEDVYQVKRILALAHVWNNIAEIERDLREYTSEVTPVVLGYYDTFSKLEKEITQVSSAIVNAEKEKIESSIHVGATLHYDTECHLHCRQKLFFDVCSVVKITPKFVTLSAKDGTEYKIRKEELVKHILLNYVRFGG